MLGNNERPGRAVGWRQGCVSVDSGTEAWAPVSPPMCGRFISVHCIVMSRHVLLQIKLNSKGLIISVGLLLASVFITVSV